MTKLVSPHYRNDDLEGLDPAVMHHLDEAYAKCLQNLRVSNPKLLVVFSGGNAVGKSTISHKIRDELGGLVIENDAIKNCLLQYMPQIGRDDLNRMTWQYSMSLYRRIDELTRNGLVVRDGVIDWYFERILPLFETAGYQLFIVGFDVSEDKMTALIKQRGDLPTVTAERLCALMADHKIHTARFRKVYTPDVMLTDKTLYDHDSVIAALRKRLQQLS